MSCTLRSAGALLWTCSLLPVPGQTLTLPWVSVLQQKKSYLERSVKEAEDNIREMLMARRAQ